MALTLEKATKPLNGNNGATHSRRALTPRRPLTWGDRCASSGRMSTST